MPINPVTQDVKNLFTANLPGINDKLKTKWTFIEVKFAWKDIANEGVKYKGFVLGDGKTKATVVLFKPTL